MMGSNGQEKSAYLAHNTHWLWGIFLGVSINSRLLTLVLGIGRGSVVRQSGCVGHVFIRNFLVAPHDGAVLLSSLGVDDRTIVFSGANGGGDGRSLRLPISNGVDHCESLRGEVATK